MANTIKIKRSAVEGKAPTTSDLALGELALNTYDGKLYTKKDNGTASIVELSGGGGGQNYSYSSSAPASPAAGDEWLDSDVGILYTYVNDGNSSAWVELGAPGFGPQGPAGTIADGDKGDITVSASGATWTIDGDTVTFAKMQNIATSRLLGRTTASSGDIEELSTGIGLSLASGSLTAVPREKSITIENPSASEKIALFFTTAAVTVSSIRSVIIGSTSVTFSIRYGTDFSGAGTEVVTGGTVANTTSTVQSTTSFNSAAIPADRLVWLTTSALSETPTQLHVTVVF
jgi:hypothetical protein